MRLFSNRIRFNFEIWCTRTTILLSCKNSDCLLYSVLRPAMPRDIVSCYSLLFISILKQWIAFLARSSLATETRDIKCYSSPSICTRKLLSLTVSLFQYFLKQLFTSVSASRLGKYPPLQFNLLIHCYSLERKPPPLI